MLIVDNTIHTSFVSTVTEIHGNSSKFNFIGDRRSVRFVSPIGGALTYYQYINHMQPFIWALLVQLSTDAHHKRYSTRLLHWDSRVKGIARTYSLFEAASLYQQVK